MTRANETLSIIALLLGGLPSRKLIEAVAPAGDSSRCVPCTGNIAGGPAIPTKCHVLMRQRLPCSASLYNDNLLESRDNGGDELAALLCL